MGPGLTPPPVNWRTSYPRVSPAENLNCSTKGECSSDTRNGRARRGEPGREEIPFGSDLLTGPLHDLISFYYIKHYTSCLYCITVIIVYYVFH